MGCDIKLPWPEWEAVESLGSGTFGEVYRAERRTHGVVSYAAVKIVHIPDDDAAISSLRGEGLDGESIRTFFKNDVENAINEIKLMERMKGTSHVVSIEDYKVLENENGFGFTLYIRMELLTPLPEFIAAHPMTEADVIQFGINLCNALSLCSKYNVIHRDIKPQNIFVSQSGSYKLGDFGNSRRLEGVSHTRSVSGTPNYNAPEVFSGREYDARVDIYSLGLILYKLLNQNRLPFMEKDSSTYGTALQRRMNNEEIPLPSEASEAMTQVILKACAFDPTDRYQTAVEFRRALEGVIGKQTPPEATEAAPAAPRSQKKKTFVILGFALLALLVVGEAVLIGVLVLKNNNSVPTSAVYRLENELALKAKMQEAMRGAMVDFLYADYDGDGTYEAFGLCENYQDGERVDGLSIWFANDDDAFEVEQVGGFLSEPVIAGQNVFYVFEISAGGSGSTSHVYGVRNGKPYQPLIAMQSEKHLQWFSGENGVFTSSLDDWSRGFHGHTLQFYRFDETDKEFYETERPMPPAVPIEKIIFFEDHIEIGQGEEWGTTMFTPTIVPDNASYPEVVWSVDSPLATIEDNSISVGNELGTFTLTASATDGSGVSASITVEIIPKQE